MPNLQFPDDIGTKAVPVGADQVLIADSVSGEVRNANLADLPVSTPVALAIQNAGGGDMSKSVYDPIDVGEQLVGVTANQALTNKTVNGVSLTASGGATTFLAGDGSYKLVQTLSGTPGSTNEVADVTTPPVAASVSYNDSEKWVKVLYTNNTYNLYTSTGNTHPFSIASGIYLYNVTGDVLITSTAKAGTYNVGTHSVTYTDGSVVSGTTGKVDFVDGQLAYINRDQTFSEPQNFGNDAIFNKRVVFPYSPMSIVPGATNQIGFDADNASKQKITLPNANPVEISFANLRAGCNYEFAIVTTGATTLSKGSIVTSPGITDFYSIGASFSDGMSLTGPDVHLFVCETFDNAIHISYLGSSRAV